MENKNILVLYIAHFINDFSLSQYYKLKNELPDGYDIVWWLDDNCCDNLIDGIKFIKFPHNSIYCFGHNQYKWINPMKYMEQFYIENEQFRDYDYYWIIEYDVYFNGNWDYLFKTVDKYDEDLVGSCFTSYKKNFKIEFLGDYNYFNNFENIIKSYISIYRISNTALKTIIEYNESNIKNHIYEIYIPTILNKYNLPFLSLNCKKIIIEPGNYLYDYSKNIANFYQDTGFIDNATKDFWWDVTFYDKNEMTKPNKLYTRYKQKNY